MKDNRLNVKDFISLGIYNVVFVLIMLIAAVTNLTPYTYLFYPCIGSFLGSFVFLLAVTKVPKKGAIILFPMVMVIYLFATGVQGMISAVGILIFAVIADLFLGNERKNKKRISIAYIIFTFWMSIGGEFRIFLFPDAYFAEALQSGLNADYVEILRSMTTWGWWVASIITGIIGAVVGICLAEAVMKKHLKRVGIV